MSLRHRRGHAHIFLAEDFDRLTLTQEERDWLKKTCPYFSDEYLEYLSNYRFDTSQVHIKFTVERTEGDEEYGHIDIEAVGPWIEAIFWEVPLMATLSEIYFTTVDTDWSLEGQRGMCVRALWSRLY